WSQCVCVRRMVAATGPEADASRRLPSDLAPVPQSSTKTPPEGVVNSTQDVLPPKWLVRGPGDEIDPRVPQKRASILAPSDLITMVHRRSSFPGISAQFHRWP